MKKITTTFIFLILCSGLWAQYKKASFFSKSGRTYGIGTQLYAMGDGKGSPIGFNLSFGRDRDGKRLFSFWEIRYLPSFKFSYETTDYDDNTVSINGTTKGQLMYALNYGFYILKNEAEQKFKPYVTAGINIVLLGGIKSTNADAYSGLKRYIEQDNLSVGAGGGLGGIVQLSGRFSLKVEGGYTWQYNAVEAYEEQYEQFFLFTSHPYASAGIRFRVQGD